MEIENKIRKRLLKINAFLKPQKKPKLKTIHSFRLEVKRLEAFLELMSVKNNFRVRQEIPNSLQKIYHEAGKIRKFGLELEAIHSITNNNKLSKPTRLLHCLKISKKRSRRKLRKKRWTRLTFKTRDFSTQPDINISVSEWKQFLTSRAISILDLTEQDIMSDIRSLHQLRKILKSILFILPVFNIQEKSVHEFLEKSKELIKSVEFKIGLLHDNDHFVTWLEKKYTSKNPDEQGDLDKIKEQWQNNIRSIKEDLQPLIPTTRQFALELKDKTTADRSLYDSGP